MSAGWIIIGLAWLIALIVLGIALVVSRVRSRRRIEELQRYFENRPKSEGVSAVATSEDKWFGNLAVRDFTSLMILDLELEWSHQRGELDKDRYLQLRAGWETMWSEQLRIGGLEPDGDEWQQRRDEAWQLFVERQHQPPGLPPWRRDLPQPEKLQPSPEVVAQVADKVASSPETEELVFDLDLDSVAAPEPEAPTAPAEIPPVSVAARISTGVTKQIEVTTRSPLPVELDRELPVPVPPSATSTAQPIEPSFSFTPVEPGLFERGLETVSGWPRLVAPFLVQNVGWFVGAFCFIAGTVFLVSYTTGFANALAVLGSLAVYTGLLLWAGYQMRKRREDLRISSDVLLGIAMLLCPLNLTAATRLINLAFESTGLLVIAMGAALVVLAGTYFAALLAGGLMDRSLSRRHAQLFVTLAGVQLLVPWVAQVTHWYWLAATHLILLGLLGYGLFAFSNDWVRSIFVERRKMAYYAAGLLVFAGVVSFTHLTWSFAAGLPRGYAAPFLMALGGALFFVDAALKSWVREHVYLSSFTFALYGVSVVALLLSWQTDLPQLLTLLLGVLVYGFVLFRYLSPPPLYLLLACLGWLYASTVLEAFPREWHLLVSLPALGALFWAGRWIASRALSLAHICMWVLLIGLATVAGWTLLGSQPGWLAFFSAVICALFTRYAGNFLPIGRPLVDERGEFRHRRYLVALLAGVSVGYAPSLIGDLQLAFGLVGLAGLWTVIAFYSPRVSQEALETHANSALIAILLSVAFSAFVVLQQSYAVATLVVLYALIGVVLVRLSVGFMARWLFYFGLAVCRTLGRKTM